MQNIAAHRVLLLPEMSMSRNSWFFLTARMYKFHFLHRALQRTFGETGLFQGDIQYALEKLGKSKFGFDRTVVSKFKSKRRVGSGNELVDYSRARCLGADQKTLGLWDRDWNIPELHVLVLTKRHAGSGNEIDLKVFSCNVRRYGLGSS